MATPPRSFAAIASTTLSRVACLVAASATVLAAQSRGHLTGVVHDENGKPIASVEVTAIKHAITTRTDSIGRFSLAAVPAGTLDLSFRRLAYEPVVVITELPANDTTDVDVTLTVVAQRLSGVLVLASENKVMRRVMQGFEMRRKQGVGHFVTRAQIEQRHPLVLSDMLRTVPGAMLLPGEGGRPTLRFGGVARPNCPPQYYVDGILVVGFSIDDMPPGDVEGVELYGGAAGVPPEYSRMSRGPTCGSVLIWTRTPGV